MKIVPVFLRYDYGDKNRGDSLEYEYFYKSLKKITSEVYPFWYDEYLDKKDVLQNEVIKFVDKIDPDIIFFIIMNDEFTFETYDYLKNKYVTLNWFCDDRWRFDNFTKNYAPHFTYSTTTDKFSLSKYRDIGYENTILTNWGSFKPPDIDLNSVDYQYDVSFVGGSFGYRKWIVKELLERGIKVECFGAGWENGRVSFDKMVEIFKTSRINLNIPNATSYDVKYIFSSFKNIYTFLRSPKRATEIKARHFEIPACGGFQLSNYMPSLE
ncbi:MAG TPA: hypothetical protein VK444_04700, partial [Methanobacteriaceae archaeon]|nr:hypothetical protein [Methanobacteriaceae archaeon]